VGLARDAIDGLIVWQGMSLPVDAPITNLLEARAAFERQPAKWHGIVEDLADEFSCPIFEVEQMMNIAAHQLEQGAQVKEFIPVLAVKQVKDLLRKSRRTPSRYGQHNLNHPLPSH
jgi:hypothetical protein